VLDRPIAGDITGDTSPTPKASRLTASTPDFVHDLLRPEAYPWRPPQIELIETHVSWVFLAGDFVVKVKRPVAFPFVDHRTLARRRQSCLDEVRLNRRLTDGVYLDVVPIVRTDEGCRVGAEGTPIEWATLMRRLPAAGMLDVLLERGEAPADLAARLAARLIPFHRKAAAICDGDTDAVGAMTARIVKENLDELEPFAGAPLGEAQFALVATAMHRFIAGEAALLRARAAGGWVREGHGDLIAEHICLEPDGAVQVFDCVEFNRELRCADVASDIAYLFMDLRRLGVPDIAAGLLASYRTAGVVLPDQLLRLYGAHRALVRTKIACLELEGGQSREAIHRGLAAADYLDMASAAALTVRPVLIAMSGLSGTGKSTVARRLARALGARLFTSDVVRKELAGVSGAAPAAWGEGLYSAEWTRATYARLFELAEDCVLDGQPVILDATFLASEQRNAAADLATRVGVPCVLIETICEEEEVMARLRSRTAEGESPSDATIAIYHEQRAAVAAHPPVVPPGTRALPVDTSGDFARAFDGLIAALAGEAIVQPVIPDRPA
jgi:aminoglycoside phosphotransferase family enzyme/predicted kinase